MSRPVVHALIPAAGRGERFGGAVLKQYLLIAGKPVLAHAIEAVNLYPEIAGVTVVLVADDQMFSELIDTESAGVNTVSGGASRAESVMNGLEFIRRNYPETEWVLVHDAARPCLRTADIDRMIDELSVSPWGGILAAPVRDTLKRCNEAGEIEQTVDRTHLWHALTPQMFRLGVLHEAISAALDKGHIVTDEAQAIEAAGGIVRVVEGHADNIKITHPADLALAEMFLRAQGRIAFDIQASGTPLPGE